MGEGETGYNSSACSSGVTWDRQTEPHFKNTVKIRTICGIQKLTIASRDTRGKDNCRFVAIFNTFMFGHCKYKI
jgi:hypothetical protein